MWKYYALLLCSLGFGESYGGVHDACNNTKQLPYMSQRLVNYTLNKDELAICDRYLNTAWYEMGEYVLSNTTDGCGTSYNWYMNSGQLPKKGMNSSVSVCRFEDPVNACEEPMDIAVVNCGDKFVFHLEPVQGCDEAYCIQHHDGKSQISPRIFLDAPDISDIKKPVITVDLLLKELIFFCDFNPIPSTNYLYIIEWSQSTGLSTTRLLYRSEAKENKVKEKIKFMKDTALSEEQLKNNGITSLGFTIICSVVAKKSLAGAESQPKFSQHKFCGIEVQDRTVTVVDGETASVNLRLTVPFYCQRTCKLRLEMYIPAVDHCSVSHITKLSNSPIGCGIMFSPNDALRNVTKQFKISVAFGNKPQKSNDVYGVLFKTIGYRAHRLFENYSPDIVRVHVRQNTEPLSGTSCYAHSDPHIKTFDGETYDNHNFGVFVLYENIKYKTVVQIKTAKCSNYYRSSWRPLCNCGVAIRTGRDVFIMNKCNKSVWDINFRICDDRVLQRSVKKESNGKLFRIKLPTGTSVKVSIGSFAEVDIYPSLLDKGVATGLCGNFNGRRMDDKPSTFTSLSAQASLFDRSGYQSLASWGSEIYLCKCRQKDLNTLLRGNLKDEATCSTADEKKKTCNDDALHDFDDMNICSLVRKKRSDSQTFNVHAIDTHADVTTDFRPTYRKREKKRVSKRSVFTNETAYESCIHQMNTSAFRMCTTVPTLKLDSYVDNCVDDALATGSMTWTQLHIEELKRLCVKTVEENQPIPKEVLEEVEKLRASFNFTNNTDADNSTEYSSTLTPLTTQSPNTNEFTADLLKALKSVTCPNDCNGHGKCDDGVCTCDKGFINIDCSVKEDEPPVMKGVPDLGLCDLRQRNCLRTSVFGENYVSSENLSCRLTPLIMETSGILRKKDAVIENATLRTFEEVTCALPVERRQRSLSANINDYSARGYQVAVSNDGKGFSEADVIVIFDTECVSCNKTNGSFVCTVKSGFCQSDGMCYSSGDTVGCYICRGEDPTRLRWATGPDCPVPAMSPKNENGNLWIIGATVGPVVVFLIAFTVFYKLKKRQNDTRGKIGSMNSINQK